MNLYVHSLVCHAFRRPELAVDISVVKCCIRVFGDFRNQYNRNWKLGFYEGQNHQANIYLQTHRSAGYWFMPSSHPS